MDTEQLVLKLQETLNRSLRNEGRSKKLKGEHEVLQNLTTSVAVMAEQLKNMNTNFTSLKSSTRIRGDADGRQTQYL